MKKRYVVGIGDYLFRLANKTGQGIDKPMPTHKVRGLPIWWAYVCD